MPTITEDDEILKGLRKLFKRDASRKNPPDRKMNEICVELGLTHEGEAVASSIGAKVRARLKMLHADKTIDVYGDKATTTYNARK